LSPADDIEVCDASRYILGWHSSLNTLQKKEVDEKVRSIQSDNPKFVAVMKNFNVTGTFTLVSITVEGTFSYNFAVIFVKYSFLFTSLL
jgi:hypothetical protein